MMQSRGILTGECNHGISRQAQIMTALRLVLMHMPQLEQFSSINAEV